MNKLYINKYYNKYNQIIEDDFAIYYKNFLPKDFNFNDYTCVGHINNIYNMYCTIYIESNYSCCHLCKKNIDYIELKKKCYIFNKKYKYILNENVLNKINNLLNKNINRLFIYEQSINPSTNIYFKYHYHLCKECYEYSLYYSYILNYNKYPTNIEGKNIILNNNLIIPKIKLSGSINNISKIKFPLIYECDYHSNKIYHFLDNIN